MPELQNVTLRFGEKTLLDRFSLSLPQTRTVCLFGPSGCGKTTLLRAAAGLLKPEKGSLRERAARASFLFQEDRLLPWCGALRNLTAVGIPADKAREALARLGLADEERALPAALSGGMRRRLAIARAAAFGGDYLFLDEPLRGLDAAAADAALLLLKEALAGRGGLLITHSPEEAFRLSDEILLVNGPPLCVLCRHETAAFASAEALEMWIAQNETAQTR